MLEIHMPPDVHEVPVVDPRTADAVLVDAEAQRPDEVKGRGRCGAKARDIARVRRDLGLHEHDVERQREGLRPKARGGRGGLWHDAAAYTHHSYPGQSAAHHLDARRSQPVASRIEVVAPWSAFAPTQGGTRR